MKPRRSILMIGACMIFLAGCGSDGGLKLGAGNGGIGGSAGSGSSGSGSSGSGSGSTGTGTGTSTGGVGGMTAGNPTGAVTVTAEGTTIATPAAPGITSLTNAAAPILTAGNMVLTPVTNITSPVTSGLPVTAMLGSTTVTGGKGTNPLALNVLSTNPATGSIATVSALSGGQLANVSIRPVGSALGGTLSGATSLANATIVNRKLVKGPNPLLGASVASAKQNTGSLAMVGLLSKGQPITLKLGSTPILPVGR